MGRAAAQGRSQEGQRARARVLRIGVIQGGKIIEERLLRRKETVTVGQSPACTVVIPDRSFPSKQTLFDVKDQKYTLIFNNKMRGKLSTGAKPVELRSLAGAPGTRRLKGGFYQVRLADKTRGKVVVGDVTILFQFVQPPAPTPKPVLPSSLRGGMFRNVDWPWASIFIALLLFEVPFIYQLHRVPIPKSLKWEDLPDRFAKFLVAPPDLDEDDGAADDGKGDEEEDEGDKDDESTDDAKTTKKAGRTLSAEDRARIAAERRAKILDSARTSAGMLGIIGAKSTSGAGAVADVLSGGGRGGDLDGAFAKLGGVDIASADTAGGLGGGGGVDSGAGSVAGLAAGDGAIGGVGSAAAGKKGPERRIKAIVSGKGPASVDGELDSAEIAAVVRRRLSAIRDCYERGLKRKPSLGGKIRIRFTIGEAGRVIASKTKVVENGMGDSDVASCMTGRLASWRFPKPDGGTVTVEYPFVFTASK